MKVISISSFVVHNEVSLKLTLKHYGHIMLPVPSQLYSAPMSIKSAVAVAVELEELLLSTLKICETEGETIIVHVGFLANERQVDEVIRMLNQFHSIIAAVVVDPVMGDHGKAYGGGDKRNWFKQLLPFADLAIPNYTELCLLTDTNFATESIETTYHKFSTLFPETQLIVTSTPTPNLSVKKTIGIAYREDEALRKAHFPRYGELIGGTGDLFTMGVIDHYYFRKKTITQAILAAHELVIDHLINIKQTAINELLSA
jgi:pyridoxal/pyridoxine/pyridoxamine kinase